MSVEPACVAHARGAHRPCPCAISVERLPLLRMRIVWSRQLGIPDEAMDSEPMKDVLSLPGRTIMQIPPDIYGDNQVNTEAVNTVGTWVSLGTHKDVDEDLVYQITKTIFENLQTFHAAARFMEAVNLDNALRQMNGKLHPGALRYYREIGADLPESAVPPEAE